MAREDVEKTAKQDINFAEIVRVVKQGSRTIVKLTIIGGLIGLVFAIFSIKKYSVTTIMVPQMENSISSKLGGLSSLTSLAGIDMNNLNSSETLSPLNYPGIVHSLSFQLELLNNLYSCKNVDHPISLMDYYNNYEKSDIYDFIYNYTFGLPGLIISNLKKPKQIGYGDSIVNQYIAINSDQDKALNKLSEDVSIDLSKKEGYLRLTATYNDPFLAAQVAKKAQTLLQEYITKYKIEKASNRLKFIQNRFIEKKAEFEKIQSKFSLFRDQHLNLTTAIAMSEQERLQSEYNIAYTIYLELAKQLEQAQIQVKEDTPILTIIDPVRIPIRKSSPNRPFILISWLFFGAVTGTILVFGKQYTNSLKN